VFRITKLGKPDGHPFMTCRGLGPVSPEEPIPPGHIETEIAVCLPDCDGMMDTMHIGRHHKETKDTVDLFRYMDVSMVEGCSGVEQYLKEDNRQNRWPENDNDR